MTIRNLYPSQRPTIIYNVINGRRELPVNAAYSRASAGTYVDIDGLVKTAAVDEPRFDYDPSNGEFRGLLLESAETQLVNDNESMSGWRFAQGSYDGSTLMGLPAVKYTYIPDAGDGPYMTIINAASSKKGRCCCSYYIDLGISDGPTKTAGGSIHNVYLFGSGYALFQLFYDDNLQPHAGKITYNGNSWSNGKFEAIDLGNDVWHFKLYATCINGFVDGSNSNRLYISPPGGTLYNRISGISLYVSEDSTGYSSYIPSSQRDREADFLSLTTASSFDAGFSLLLDSETTTEDFIYKIKADGEDIASLSNDDGTLDWTINGKSAAVNGEYPQVGFLPGRVRTISSFGPAEQGDVENYLYTTGISFPTTAEPAAGADEIEFGVPQTLKALYVWDGQLDETNAVSLIRGKYNVVPNDPIGVNNFSFVYNTDPENEGNLSIDLPYITPANTMTVDWGDGNSNTYGKGVVPSHTYPYPGQYRIQISGNETWDPPGDITGTLVSGGFDELTLAGSLVPPAVITRVDQWAPQYRVDATGDGFTGSDLVRMLFLQSTCNYIPDFKYTDLTSLYQAFGNCGKMNDTATYWTWIPVNLPVCTSLYGAFSNLARYIEIEDTPEGGTVLPQLQTASVLNDVRSCFSGCFNTGWFTPDRSPTTTPFTVTIGIQYWDYCFSKYRGTELGLMDTSSAESILAWCSDAINLTFVQPYTLGNCKNFQQAWENCRTLENFPVNINTRNGETFTATWAKCASLKGFPPLDFTNARNVQQTWMECESLLEFPEIDFPIATNFIATWQKCESLTKFPDIDVSNGTNFQAAWEGCKSLPSFPKLTMDNAQIIRSAWKDLKMTSFPAIDLPNVTDAYGAWWLCEFTSFPKIDLSSATNIGVAWQNCYKLEEFPEIDFPSATNLKQAWRACSSLTQFPSVDVSAGVDFGYAWSNCSSLTDFSAGMFDSTGTLASDAFEQTFTGSALSAQSIENVLVSLDTNGQSSIELGINGGTNEDYKDWTEAAKTAYQNLIDKGWDITLNDTDGIAPSISPATSGFYVNHQDGVIAFGELTTGSRHASGKANQEVCADEGKAIARVLELDQDYFPAWNREDQYFTGDRVKFGTCVFRALKQNDPSDFELPDLESDPDAEIPTPMNRQARWEMVCGPSDQDLEDETEEETPAVFVAEEVRERRRARNANGTFRADDPSTPDVNEAWE